MIFWKGDVHLRCAPSRRLGMPRSPLGAKVSKCRSEPHRRILTVRWIARCRCHRIGSAWFDGSARSSPVRPSTQRLRPSWSGSVDGGPQRRIVAPSRPSVCKPADGDYLDFDRLVRPSLGRFAGCIAEEGQAVCIGLSLCRPSGLRLAIRRIRRRSRSRGVGRL